MKTFCYQQINPLRRLICVAASFNIPVFVHVSVALTSIRQTPAVCVFAQQAAECVPVFVQVDVRSADPHHLPRKGLKTHVKRPFSTSDHYTKRR